MSETQSILDAARERGLAAIAAEPRPDYAAANKAFHRQKAALTRAIHSGKPELVEAAVIKAVREWRKPPFSGMWPDDWSRWQRALDDVLGWGASIDIADIR